MPIFLPRSESPLHKMASSTGFIENPLSSIDDNERLKEAEALDSSDTLKLYCTPGNDSADQTGGSQYDQNEEASLLQGEATKKEIERVIKFRCSKFNSALDSTVRQNQT